MKIILGAHSVLKTNDSGDLISINVVTVNIKSKADQKIVDNMINKETKRKLLAVTEAKSFNIMTACMIDSEFIVVSEYDIEEDLRAKLLNA